MLPATPTENEELDLTGSRLHNETALALSDLQFNIALEVGYIHNVCVFFSSRTAAGVEQ